MRPKHGLWPLVVALAFAACGGSEEAPAADASAGEPAGASERTGPRTVSAVPDPCAWLSPSEAQEVIGLDEPPSQTPMGGADAASRACVYTDPEQTAWINVAYQGLNPQVFSAQGKSEEELIELASTVYADGLEHLRTTETDGHPTLAFGDADRTLMVVFTDIGRARDLPEGISDRLAISSYYNPTLLLHAPGRSQEDRLAALEELVERPVRQLTEAAGG